MTEDLEIVATAMGGDTIRDMEAAIRELTKAYKGLSAEERAQAPGMAKIIELAKNTRNQAMAPLRSESDKLMRSYFVLGQQMRSMLVPMMQLPPGLSAIAGGMMGLVKSMTLLARTAGGMTAIFKSMSALMFSPTGLIIGVGLATAAFSSMGDEAKNVEESEKKLNDELEKQRQIRADIVALKYELGIITSAQYTAAMVAEMTLLQTELERLSVMEALIAARASSGVVGPDLSQSAVIAGSRGLATAPSDATGVTRGAPSDKEVMNQTRIEELKKSILELTKKIKAVESGDDRESPLTGGFLNRREFDRGMERRTRKMERDIDKSVEDGFKKGRSGAEMEMDGLYDAIDAGFASMANVMQTHMIGAFENIFGAGKSLLGSLVTSFIGSFIGKGLSLAAGAGWTEILGLAGGGVSEGVPVVDTLSSGGAAKSMQGLNINISGSVHGDDIRYVVDRVNRKREARITY